MAIIKYSEGEIVTIIKADDDKDDEKAKRALKAAQQAAKNISKDGELHGNKTSFNTESD